MIRKTHDRDFVHLVDSVPLEVPLTEDPESGFSTSVRT